jgi:chromodomain-helicase-DNA-binding protein 1
MASTPLGVSTKTRTIVSFTFIFDRRFVTLFWPKKVKASKLEDIHAKMVMKEAAPRASAPAEASSSAKKPRPSTGGKSNGAPSGIAIKTNGKAPR